MDFQTLQNWRNYDNKICGKISQDLDDILINDNSILGLSKEYIKDENYYFAKTQILLEETGINLGLITTSYKKFSDSRRTMDDIKIDIFKKIHVKNGIISPSRFLIHFNSDDIDAKRMDLRVIRFLGYDIRVIPVDYRDLFPLERIYQNYLKKN